MAVATANAFASGGARQLFGLPGESVNPLLEACRTNDRLQVVRVRHERWAPVAALADSLCHERPSGSFASAGPGVVTLLRGLTTWGGEDLPLVALTGQVATEELGTGAFQELDVPSLCGWAVPTREVTTAAELPWLVEVVATSGRRRQPLLVSVPWDLWGLEVPGWSQPGGPDPLKRLLSEAAAVEVDTDAAAILGPMRPCPEHDVEAQPSAAPSFEIRDCVRPRAGGQAVAVTTSERAVQVLGSRLGQLSGLVILNGSKLGAGRVGDVPIAWSRPSDVAHLLAWRGRAEGGTGGATVPGGNEPPPALLDLALTVDRLGQSSFVLVDDPGVSRSGDRLSVGATTVVRSALPGFALAATLAIDDPAVAVCDLASAVNFAQEFPGWLDRVRRGPLVVHLVDEPDGGTSRRRAAVAAGLASVGLTLTEVDDAGELLRRAERTLAGIHVDMLSRSTAQRARLLPADPPIRVNPTPMVDLPLPAGLAVFTSEQARPFVAPSRRLTVAPAEHATLMASGHAKATRSKPIAVVTDREVVAALPGILDARYDGRGFVLFIICASPDATSPALGALRSIVDHVVSAGNNRPPSTLTTLGADDGAVTVVLCSPEGGTSEWPQPPPPSRPPVPRQLPSPDTVQQLARLLAAQPRVTMLLGRGSMEAVEAVTEVARFLPSVLVTTMLGPSGNDLPPDLYGGRAGESGNLAAYLALRSASLLLRIGVSNRGRGFLPSHGQPVVDITVDGLGASLGDHRHVVRGRARDVLELLRDSLADEPVIDHLRASRQRHLARSRLWTTWKLDERLRRPARGQLRSSDVVLKLSAQLRAVGERVPVTVDTGTVTLWAYRFLRVPGPILWGGGYATMGFAVPAAAGAALSRGSPAVALVGDGGTLTSLSMFPDLADRQPPVTIVILNNSGLAAIRFEQMARSWPEFALAVGPFDFESYCRSLGLQFCRAVTPGELEWCMSQVPNRCGPLVIEAVVDGTEVPVPWIPTASQVRGRLAALMRSVVPSPAVHGRGSQSNLTSLSRRS